MLLPHSSAMICNVQPISHSYNWLLVRFGCIPLTGFAVARHQISYIKIKEDKKIPISGTVRPTGTKANDHLHANCQDFPRGHKQDLQSELPSPALHYPCSLSIL